jgi:hypothetical protein
MPALGRVQQQGNPGASADIGEMQSEKPVPCREIAVLVARTPPPASKPTPVWGVELVGGPTDATALAAYSRLEQKYASILGARKPTSVHHGVGRGSMGWAPRDTSLHVRGARPPPNLIGNAVATIVVSKWEGVLDEAKMRSVLAGESEVEAKEPEKVLA